MDIGKDKGGGGVYGERKGWEGIGDWLVEMRWEGEERIV